MNPNSHQTPRRLAAVFGMLLVTAFIVTTLVVAKKAGKMAREEAVGRLRDTGHYHAARFAAHLIEPLFTARSFAIALGSAAGSKGEVRREDYDRSFLPTLRAQPEYFGVWAIFGPGRFGSDPSEGAERGYVPYAYRQGSELVFEHDDFQTDRELDYYRIPYERKRESIIEPYIDAEAGDVLMSSLAVPVFARGEVIGVAGVDVELASLSEQISKVRPCEEGHAILVSGEGLIVAHSNAALAGQKMTVAGFDESQLKKVIAGMEFDEVRPDPVTGESVWYTFTPVAIGDTGTTWTMVQVVPSALIMQRAESITWWTSLIAALSIIVLFAVLILFVRSVVQPLHDSNQTVTILLNSMVDAVVMHDKGGIIRSFNQRFPELLGLETEAVSGTPMPELLRRYGSTPLYEKLPEAGSEDVAAEQGTLINEQGLVIPIEITARRVSVSGEACFLTMIRDVSARVKHDEEMRNTMDRIRRQESAVLQLALLTPEGEGIEDIYRRTSELAARTLGVSRVGIWTGNDTIGTISCVDLFDVAKGEHSAGIEICSTDYPEYFRAISVGRCIDAHDARTDPRTCAFNDGLLEPLGITSMLDSVIRVSGTIEGIVCFEHTGPARAWTEDEICFASQLADQLAKFIVHFRMKGEEEHRRKLEVQFQQTQKLESLGIMAGGIAHDFNNLLLTIIGNLEMSLSGDPDAPGTRQSLEESHKASLLAADLCGQMLAYSGKAHFIVHAVHLTEIAREMVTILESSIRKRADLRLTCPDVLPVILGDSAQLRQILLNLIINAADAMTGKRGNIDIRITTRECEESYFEGTMLKEPLEAGTYVQMEVSDDGCGMDANTIHRIFDPFFTTKFTGRGLGLAAVLGIVRGHRGAIQIDSTVGEGTTFRVLLPVAPAVTAVESSVIVRPPVTVPIKEGTTILVVDDDDGVRMTISRQLMRLGFHVVTAADGFEALELVEKGFTHRNGNSPDTIDLVLLDLTMQHMDGAETFEKMHVIAPHLPVVLCSGYSDEELRTRFQDKDIAGYLCKPFEIRALKAAVHGALAKTLSEGSEEARLCVLAG